MFDGLNVNLLKVRYWVKGLPAESGISRRSGSSEWHSQVEAEGKNHKKLAIHLKHLTVIITF
jgi:hypothetical protein